MEAGARGSIMEIPSAHEVDSAASSPGVARVSKSVFWTGSKISFLNKLLQFACLPLEVPLASQVVICSCVYSQYFLEITWRKFNVWKYEKGSDWAAGNPKGKWGWEEETNQSYI